jgi:2-polyprenyl-6-methoxyphenol hydroxylase-like FAD-dependent oxidoreductase
VSVTYDVTIVGGGIAGAALGGVLADAGLGVVIVEKERVFRDRVRGEGIHPWGVAEAKRLGLLPVLAAAGANELPIWQSYDRRMPVQPFRWADVSIEGLSEIAVSHPRLQEATLDWAHARGANVLRPAKVVELKPGPEITVSSEGGDQTLRARLLVGADGRQSAVRRWIGATVRRDPVHHRIGGGLIDGVALDTSATHETRFAGGRMFVMPQGGGRSRAYYISSTVGLVESRADRSPGDFVRACAACMPEGAFSDAIPAGPVAFFPNADVWSSVVSADNTVLIGDAAAANDPSVGHGLSIAFRDVRVIRDLLLNESNWNLALTSFADGRHHYYEVLRAHAQWLGILVTEEGRDADRRRERFAIARETDPSAGGFSLIFARGPDGLIADEASRRRFFGEEGE